MAQLWLLLVNKDPMVAMVQLLKDVAADAGDQHRTSAKITRLVYCSMMTVPDAVELDPWTRSFDRNKTSSIDQAAVVAGGDVVDIVAELAAVIRQHFPCYHYNNNNILLGVLSN
jgi:hypothetical protein